MAYGFRTPQEAMEFSLLQQAYDPYYQAKARQFQLAPFVEQIGAERQRRQTEAANRLQAYLQLVQYYPQLQATAPIQQAWQELAGQPTWFGLGPARGAPTLPERVTPAWQQELEAKLQYAPRIAETELTAQIAARKRLAQELGLTGEEAARYAAGIPREIPGYTYEPITGRWLKTEKKEEEKMTPLQKQQKASQKQLALTFLKGGLPTTKTAEYQNPPKYKEEAYYKLSVLKTKYPWIDLSDPDIRKEIDKLPSQPKGIYGAPWFLRPLPGVYGGRKYPEIPEVSVSTPKTSTSTVEERYNELAAQGLSEDEIYRQLAEEGY
jgi:hypothetical protein